MAENTLRLAQEADFILEVEMETLSGQKFTLVEGKKQGSFRGRLENGTTFPLCRKDGWAYFIPYDKVINTVKKEIDISDWMAFFNEFANDGGDRLVQFPIFMLQNYEPPKKRKND